jgi:hypothetical protein
VTKILWFILFLSTKKAITPVKLIYLLKKASKTLYEGNNRLPKGNKKIRITAIVVEMTK